MIPDSPFARHAADLVRLGYSPVPVRAGSKLPLLKQWDRLRQAPLSFDTIANLAARNPQCGIAVLGGFNCLVPIDVDTADPEIHAAVARVLPKPTVAKRGRLGYTAFYWDASGMLDARKFMPPPPNRKPIVEILVTGQSVIPPTLHPETQQPYRWLTDATLFDVPVDSLPQITHEHGVALEKALSQWVPEPKRYVPPTPSDTPLASDKRMQAYARAVLDGEVRMLLGTRNGRNCQLFHAACKMGKYVHHNLVSFGDVEAALIGAATSNGYLKKDGLYAARSTIKSGVAKAEHDALPALPSRARVAA